MARTRDHHRPWDFGQAGSKLKSIVKGADKSYGRKIVERLPSGEFALVAKCVTKDRHGAIRERWVVVGSNNMRLAVSKCLPQIQEAHSRTAARDPDGSLLVIPGTAEARARRARELMRQAWEHHVRGTAWEGKKQMYKVVAAGGPPFSWWDGIAQASFVATAVNDPNVSMRVCCYLGRELYERAQR